MSLVSINATNWINSHVGTITDIDGAAGIQCVDLYKTFLRDIGYPNPTRPIGGDGYADNIWYNRNALGLAPYFDFVTGQCKKGDIVIWAKGAAECPYSHVAMFVNDDPSNPARGVFLGANQVTPHSRGVLTSLSMSGSLGALRYKGFTSTSSNPAPTPGPSSKCDQILSPGSKVTFEPKLKVDGVKGDWIHCNTVSPDPKAYLPAGPLKETSAADGNCDQILHVGSEFTYPGTYSVDGLAKDKYGQWIAHLKEIDCYVRPACLIEVAEGR